MAKAKKVTKKAKAKKPTLKQKYEQLKDAIRDFRTKSLYNRTKMQFHYEGLIKKAEPGKPETMIVGMANVSSLFAQIQTAQTLGYEVHVTAEDNGSQRVQFSVYEKLKLPEIP